mgnify:CR=1 FL=1
MNGLQYQETMPQAVAYASVSERLSFIRKVYLGLTAMLLGTMAASAASLAYGLPTMLLDAAGSGLIFWIAIIAASFGVYFVRKVPGLNILGMAVLSAMMGVAISPLLYVAHMVQPGQHILGGIVAQAFLLTSSIFVGLTVYVFTTRKDFSWLGGALWVGFFLLLACIIGFMIFGMPSQEIYIAYCIFGVLLFTGFILYDTSIIIHHLSTDEWVAGSLNLFFDFINLFLYILRLLLILAASRE